MLRQTVNLASLDYVEEKRESSSTNKRTEKDVWNFLDHGFFYEHQLDQLETRMLDQDYVKPEMVEDPDPEIEDDDLEMDEMDN